MEPQRKGTKINWNLVISILIFSFNTYWIWDNLYLLYLYRFSGILWFYMHPYWVLILNAILGFIGYTFGIQLIRRKIKIKTAILLDSLIFVFGALLKLILSMFW